MYLTEGEVEGLGGPSGGKQSCELGKNVVGLAAWGEECGRGTGAASRGEALFLTSTQIREAKPAQS